MNSGELEVKCYSGSTYAERPQSFTWRGVTYQVERLEKTWREPGKSCFRVSTRGDKLYNLCYDEAGLKWTLTVVHEGVTHGK